MLLFDQPCCFLKRTRQTLLQAPLAYAAPGEQGDDGSSNLDLTSASPRAGPEDANALLDTLTSRLKSERDQALAVSAAEEKLRDGDDGSGEFAQLGGGEGEGGEEGGGEAAEQAEQAEQQAEQAEISTSQDASLFETFSILAKYGELSLLAKAAALGKVDDVSKFLAAGDDPLQLHAMPGGDQGTALHVALMFGQPAAAEALLLNSPSLLVTASARGQSPFVTAARSRSNRVEMLKVLHASYGKSMRRYVHMFCTVSFVSEQHD